MARVVQGQNKPPYLLIVFAFLFVVAAILAVVGHLGKDELENQVLTQEDRITELEEEVSGLSEYTDELVFKITGTRGGSPQAAIDAADRAYEEVEQRGGLAVELINLSQRMDKKQQQVNDLQAKISSLTDQVKAKENEISTLSADLKQKSETLNNLKTAQEDEIASIQQQHTKQLTQAEQERKALREEMQKAVENREQKIEELILSMQDQEKVIRKLREQLKEVRIENQPGVGDVVNRADGKVFKVVQSADVCYINLGQKDQVKSGMTFAVYGVGAENKEDIKGRIRVTETGADYSECKIVQQNEDNPIVSGDSVANLVYHAAGTYVFLVAGNFDLDDSGLATAKGREELIDAIRRFGGTMTDELDYRTDYVVLGEEPDKPSQPSPDATDATQRAYQQAMKRYKSFFDIKEKAEQLQIPILNTNRFLIFTGYMPEKPPQ